MADHRPIPKYTLSITDRYQKYRQYIGIVADGSDIELYMYG